MVMETCQCRRNPPTGNGFPTVRADDWCGAFAEATTAGRQRRHNEQRMRTQGKEQMLQGRLFGRFRRHRAVPRDGMRMPAMPVAQIPGACQADLGRMALLGVELAAKADARLVLKRRNARIRAKTRCDAQWTQAPSDAHTARNRAKTRPFRGFLGVFRGPGGAGKGPPGWVLPGDKRLRAAGRSRLIDHSWFQCPSAFRDGKNRAGRRPCAGGQRCRL